MIKYCLAWMLGIVCVITNTSGEACEWWHSRYAQNYPTVVAQSVLVYNVPAYNNNITVAPLVYLPTTTYYINNPVVAQTVWVPTTYNTISTQIVYKPYTVYKY